MLPIDEHLPAVKDALDRARAVVVTAAPGAGKTTRVPPALVADGPVLLLQPRRVAARAIARRIADERGWTLGEEVGWQVRFDRRASARTRLLVATEGVLTAFAQQDPLLSSWRTVVVDEFHERTIHADLGLAFARQAWLARDDLRLVVMSATINTAAIAAWLGNCPVVSVDGRQFPVAITYCPGRTVVDVARQVTGRERGAVLCFLPGVADIERAERELAGVAPVFPLHGRLDPDRQDAALRPSDSSRIVLATNVAETTVTVPDVTVVIDSGVHKVARFDAARGLNALVTERISADSAEQRAGRAGRTQAGDVYRLWDSRDRLRPHRDAEIGRVDLSATLVEVMAWGADPTTFEWFEAPPSWMLETAMDGLRRIGVVGPDHRLTADARRFRTWPVHPRLARMIWDAGASAESVRVAVALSEGLRLPPAAAVEGRDSDLSVFADASGLPPAVARVADDVRARVGAVSHPGVSLSRAVLAAYPDRVAQRRQGQREAYLLSTGTGAVLARDSGVRDAEWLVAVDVASPDRVGRDAIIRIAVSIDPAWLTPTRSTLDHEVDAAGQVRATRRQWYDAILLRADPVAPDDEQAARALLGAWRQRPRTDEERQLAARLRCAGMDVTLETLAEAAVVGARTLDDLRLVSGIGEPYATQLRSRAPETMRLPSGRDRPLEYRDDGSVVMSVKLQEVFGLAETPMIGVHRVPVTFELLAPNQRPVQVTRDLRSFWTRGYPEVRKELRGRYPRHPWPDDPWTAVPTHRAKPR